MIELKPIKRMMNEYRILLEGYEAQLEKLTVDDCKRIIGEVKMFWYRNKKYVDYFFAHISEIDEVAFLAGAVRLDIANNGHYEYVNTYLKECIHDILLLFRNYSDDFYVLPIDYITSSDDNEYHSILIDTADDVVLSMFSVKYNSIQEIDEENTTYEDIEKNLLPHIRDKLIFDGLEEVKMSLRDRCTNYLKNYGDRMPFMKDMGETQLFITLVTQNCMQVLSVVATMKNFHMIPFIRNDVTFQYFTLLFHSNISSEFTEKNYLNVYIPYVVQKAFDFSDMDYVLLKDYMGNGKMINAVLSSFEQGTHPLPEDVVGCIESYVNAISVNIKLNSR